MPTLALALLLAVSSGADPAPAAAAAAPAEPSFRNGFTPHPFTAEVKAPIGSSTLTSKGYGKCGSAPTSDEPAFAFTIEAPLSDLRLTTDKPAVLVQPDRTFVCVAESVWLSNWQAGRYQVLLSGTAAELTAKIRLDQPVRSQADVKAAVERAPELVLTTAIASNPAFHALKPTATFAGRSSGVGCAPETMAPLARVKVPYPSTWDIVARDGAPLVLAPSGGGCLTSLRALRLEAGDYVLWAAPQPGAEKAVWEVAIGDEGRPLVFGEAPTYDLGALPKPMLISGKTSDGSWGPSRAGTCANLPRAPSFYVKGADALRSVEMLVWPDRGGLGDKARFSVYGPLEGTGAGRPMRCDLSRPTFRELRGTYAVFVTGGGQPSQELSLLVRRLDLPTDYAFTPVAVPEPLPALADRALSKYYPFFREGLDARRYFLTAPKQLFVALGGGNVPALVVLQRELTLDILKLDGTVETVGASEIVPEVKKAPALPATLPPPKPVATVDEAIAAAGPAEEPFLRQYFAVEGAVNACSAAWLAKNDAEWSASQEIFRASTAEPRGDRAPNNADKVCGAKRIDAAGKLLVKQVNASRAKNAKAFLAALKQRFK